MKKVFYFLLTLVMCVSIMPSIASASSEAGSVCEEYDPKTGYTTITTDDYTAIVPKGGEVVYSSGSKRFSADEVLQTTTYSSEDSIVPFDYQATVAEMYDYILETHADMEPSSAMEIAQKLASNIEAARNAAIYGDAKSAASYVTESGAVVFDLGCIRNGTINGTAENGSDDGNDKNSETGLPGYDANAAVGYAYSWWNKTNNTTYGYYARYNNHPDPTNNNMWSEGTGNNYRTWADCANYVSQCLAAGGAQQIKKGLILPHTRTGNWYYSDSKPSHTWGGASNFFNHWSDRVGTRSSASQTKKGDPFRLRLLSEPAL